MNIPVTPAVVTKSADLPEMSALRSRPLDDATLVALAPNVSAAYFDRPSPGARERLVAKQNGASIPNPFIAGAFELRTGGLRHVLLMARGIDEVLSRPLALYIDDRLAAGLDPNWLQPPIADLASLVEGLTENGRLKLLRMLLTTGASLFLSAAGPALIESFRALMGICDLSPVDPVSAAGFGAQTVLSYPASGCGGLPGQADVVVLARERPALLRKVSLAQEGQYLHIHLPAAAQDCEVVLFGERPYRLAPPPATMRRLPASVWLEGRGAPVRDWLLEQIVAAAQNDPGAANALRELRPGAVDPKLVLNHLSATRALVLHSFELIDPQRLVRAVLIERGDARVELAVQCDIDGICRMTGGAALPGRADAAEIYRIHILHHSGRLREVARGVLDPFDGAPPPEFAAAWVDAEDRGSLERSLADACLGAIRPAVLCQQRRFGVQRSTALSIVTDFGESVALLRARAAAIFAERGAQKVEVICALSEGPLAAAARRAIEDVVAVYGIPHVVVSVPETATPAERLCAALGAANGPVLVLAEAVLPAHPGWLSAWMRRLSAAREDLVCSVLLASDGSVAAVESSRDDVWRGLPASRLPEMMRNVRWPVADCFGLTDAGVRKLSAQTVSHPDPAVLLAQLIPAQGVSVSTRHSFVRFSPASAANPFADAVLRASLALLKEAKG